MSQGTVKWFNSEKGFGFIAPDDGGKDAFVHISAVERSGLNQLREGDKVSFELVADSKTARCRPNGSKSFFDSFSVSGFWLAKSAAIASVFSGQPRMYWRPGQRFSLSGVRKSGHRLFADADLRFAKDEESSAR